MSVDVTCLGSITADVLAAPVPDPLPHGKLAQVDQVSLRAGGCALNGASVLRQLGAAVRVAGRVGDDEFGRFLLRTLDERGIDRGAVTVAGAAATSASIVLVDDAGERTFLHHVGAKAELAIDQFDLDVLLAARALHIGGALLMPMLDGAPSAALLKEARARGLQTSLDTAWDPNGGWDRMLECLPHLDLFCPNLDEARAISGFEDPAEAAAWLRRLGAVAVVVTLGADGCYADAPGFRGAVPAPHVEVVDGTGAGDAFAASLVLARLEQLPWPEALAFASACGSLATTTVGGGGAAITRERVAELLANG